MSSKKRQDFCQPPNAGPGTHMVKVTVRHEVVEVPVPYVFLGEEPLFTAPAPYVLHQSEEHRCWRCGSTKNLRFDSKVYWCARCDDAPLCMGCDAKLWDASFDIEVSDETHERLDKARGVSRTRQLTPVGTVTIRVCADCAIELAS